MKTIPPFLVSDRDSITRSFYRLENSFYSVIFLMSLFYFFYAGSKDQLGLIFNALCLVVTLIATSIALWRNIVASKGLDPRKESYDGLIGIKILLVILFCWRIFPLQELSVWGDEITQGQFVETSYPAAAAAIQHQPFLGYLVTFWSTYFLGQTEIGLRLFSLIFGLASSFGLFLLLLNIRISRLIAFLTVAIYSFIPLIDFYGFEARPVAFGTFVLIILLWKLKEYSETSEKSERTLNFFSLVAVTLLFLFSVGYQTAFMTCALIVASLLVEFRQKRFKSSAFPLLFGLILFLPFQYAIIKIAPSRFDEVLPILNIRQSLEVLFRHLRTDAIFPVSPLFSWFLIFSAFLLLLHLYWQKSGVLFNYIKIVLIASIIFFIVAPVYFVLNVRWFMMPKYFLIGMVPVGMFSAFLLAVHTEKITSLWRISRVRIELAITSLCLIGMAVFLISNQNPDPHIQFHRTDYNKVFSLFLSQPKGRLVYHICPLDDQPCWESNHLNFFMKRKYPNLPFALTNKYEQFSANLETTDRLNGFYVLMHSPWWLDPVKIKELESFSSVKRTKVRDLVIFEFEKELGLIEFEKFRMHLKQFFAKYPRFLKNSENVDSTANLL